MDPEQKNLSTELALGILRRRGLVILVCLVVGIAAGIVYSKQKTKEYTATSAVTFEQNPLDQQIAGLSVPTSSPENLLAEQTRNRETVRMGNTAAKTAKAIGHGLTAEDVSKSLSVGAQGETSIIEISATTPSPRLAAEIANTYAAQFVKLHKKTIRRYFQSALAIVNKQLSELSAEQRVGADGLNLQNRAQTLGLLSELDYENTQVSQEAFIPSSPSAPHTKRNIALGVVLGLAIGFLLAFLLERFDRRIRDPESFETIYALPILGNIPKLPSRSKLRRGGADKDSSSAGTEAFNLVRAHLRFFNVDRELRTIMVASPTPGDGKTTIARGLAQAAARSGIRTLLIEADLRRPGLARELPELREGPGLAQVLSGSISLVEAVQSPGTPASSIDPHGYSGPDVLTAGGVPPNPGELLESGAMVALLGEAKSRYGLIVLDTPPLGAVSDAFPLLAKVDGVVVVGRVGKSRRDGAELLSTDLDRSDAPTLGIVANESKVKRPTYYDSGRPTPTDPRSGLGDPVLDASGQPGS